MCGSVWVRARARVALLCASRMGEGDGCQDRAGEVFWPLHVAGPTAHPNPVTIITEIPRSLFLAVESAPAVNQAAQAVVGWYYH